jgi:hypothetical protein
MKPFLFVVLTLVGCASQKPCADGMENENAGVRFYNTSSVHYYACKGPCHREDNPVDCACTTRCPCWNYHKSGDAQRQEKARKERAENQLQFDQARDHHLHGRYAEAMAIFKKLFFYNPGTKLENISAYNIACEYAMTGDKPFALEWLEISFKKGFSDIEHVKQDKDLDSLRDEARYKKLVGE